MYADSLLLENLDRITNHLETITRHFMAAL